MSKCEQVRYWEVQLGIVTKIYHESSKQCIERIENIIMELNTAQRDMPSDARGHVKGTNKKG